MKKYCMCLTGVILSWIAAAPALCSPQGNISPTIKVMTLGEAISYALENNPGLNAERGKLGLARGQKTQADLLLQNNPQIFGGYNNRNTGRDNSNAVGKEHFNDFQFTLSQEFEVGGQPGLRREAARLNLTRAEWEIKDAQRRLTAEVKDAFYLLLVVKEKVQLAQQVVDFRREILDISQKGYEAGNISKLQVTLNQVGLIRAQKEQSEIKQEYNQSLFHLKQVINWEADRELEIEGKPDVIQWKPDKAGILKFALDNRPDIKSAQYDLERAGKQSQLARREAIPNVTLSANYQRDTDGNVIGGGITVPVPLFNRRQGEIEQSLAEESTTGYRLAELRTAVSREAVTAAENFTLAADSLAAFQQEILPRISQTLELIKESFRLGQVDQLTVTVSQDEFIQTRFVYLESLGKYYQTLVELESAAAADIPVLTSLKKEK